MPIDAARPPFVIRPARASDVPSIVALHQEAFPGFFLTSLGPQFLTLLYSEMLSHGDGLLLVAEGPRGPLGFVGGVVDESAFFADLRKRRRMAFVAAAARSVGRNPRVIGRLWRARHRQEEGLPECPAVLLSIASHPSARGSGVGESLWQQFRARLASKGVASFRLTTDLIDNDRVIAFYRRMGMTESRRLTTPEGRSMVEFVWGFPHPPTPGDAATATSGHRPCPHAGLRGCVVMTANAIVFGNAVIGPALSALSRDGWHVHLMTDATGVPAEHIDRAVRLHHVALGRDISPMADLRVLVQWWRWMREIGPDIVIGNSPKGALLGLLAARAAGVGQRVYWIRGARWDGPRSRTGELLKAMDRLTIRISTHQLLVSRSLWNRYTDVGIALPRPVLLGHGGSRGIVTAPFARVARHRASPAAGTLRMGYLGRIANGKGLQDLPDLLDLVRTRIPDASLTLVGPEDAGDPIPAELLDRLRAHPAIAYRGATTDVPGALAGFDVLVFPSLREGMPNAVLEAQAAGLPVFAWDVTGVRDAVQDHVTGRLFAQGDVVGMADELVDLAQNPERYAAMSAAAGAFVREQFEAEVVLGRILLWLAGLVTPEGDIRSPDGESARALDRANCV